MADVLASISKRFVPEGKAFSTHVTELVSTLRAGSGGFGAINRRVDNFCQRMAKFGGYIRQRAFYKDDINSVSCSTV